PGVTLELLHLEYLEQHPDGYRYTQFCEVYRRWLQRRGLSMRQVHRAGEKCFVDYAGQKPKIIEPTTGEVIEVEHFVAVLGASPASVTRPSSPSPPSTRGSPSSSRISTPGRCGSTGPVAASSSSDWTSRPFGHSPPKPSSTATGRSALASASTTTSSSTAITTPCLTRYFMHTSTPH